MLIISNAIRSEHHKIRNDDEDCLIDDVELNPPLSPPLDSQWEFNRSDYFRSFSKNIIISCFLLSTPNVFLYKKPSFILQDEGIDS